MEGELRVFREFLTTLRPSVRGVEVYKDVTSNKNKEIGLLVGRTTSTKTEREREKERERGERKEKSLIQAP